MQILKLYLQPNKNYMIMFRNDSNKIETRTNMTRGMIHEFISEPIQEAKLNAGTEIDFIRKYIYSTPKKLTEAMTAMKLNRKGEDVKRFVVLDVYGERISNSPYGYNDFTFICPTCGKSYSYREPSHADTISECTSCGQHMKLIFQDVAYSLERPHHDML